LRSVEERTEFANVKSKNEPKEVFQKISGTKRNEQSCSKLFWSEEEQ